MGLNELCTSVSSRSSTRVLRPRSPGPSGPITASPLKRGGVGGCGGRMTTASASPPRAYSPASGRKQQSSARSRAVQLGAGAAASPA
jgi:hypothetical protein